MRDADEAVIVEGDFRGTHQGPWRGLPPTGRAVDFPVIIVFEFEGDRMLCERTYFDLGMPLRQLGVARDPNTRSGQIAAALNHPVTIGRAVIGELRRRRSAAMPPLMRAGARDSGARPPGWRPRAVVGAEITNAVSGERLVFLQTHASSQGKLFQAEILMPADNYVIESHFHPSQVERFKVISGQLGVRVGNAIQYITEGQDVVVPIRTTHSYWNAGRGELRILYEHRPALVSAEVFFLTYFALSRAGKLSPTGQMNLLQSAVLIRDVGDFIRPPQPPLAIQGPLFAPLAALGDMLGYRPWYREYLDPRPN
jgi:mannose-6-phosphate isomerase-like protein (cupin superfamily)